MLRCRRGGVVVWQVGVVWTGSRRRRGQVRLNADFGGGEGRAVRIVWVRVEVERAHGEGSIRSKPSRVMREREKEFAREKVGVQVVVGDVDWCTPDHICWCQSMRTPDVRHKEMPASQ